MTTPDKSEIQKLYEPNMRLFWGELLVFTFLGWALFVIGLQATSLALTLSCLILSSISLYRVVIFTHEMVHQTGPGFYNFRIAWHFLVGIVLMVPHFMHRKVHLEHHKKKIYGTEKDPEYINFSYEGNKLIPFLLLLVTPIVGPLFSLLRFCILGPVSTFSPSLRKLVITRMSTLAMRIDYVRNTQDENSDPLWRFEEFSTSIVYIVFICGIVSGLLSWKMFFSWYLLSSTMLLLNTTRGIFTTHRYESDGAPLSRQQQFEDSLNYNSESIFSKIIAPTGMRYHALHHLYPNVPYHNLKKLFYIFEKNKNSAIYLENNSSKSISTLIRGLMASIEKGRERKDIVKLKETG